MNPLNFSFRVQFALGAAICAGLVGYALYAQHVLGLEPCPLCIFQRLAFMALGAVFLVGALHAPSGRAGRAIYAVLAALAAGVGMGVAGRHVWLQSLPPDQVPACGPGLDYMLEAFPFWDVLARVFRGSGECAEVDWLFLGLSMPAWNLIVYGLFAAGALWAGLRRR